MARKKEKRMTDLVSDEMGRLSTMRTYVVTWAVTVSGTTLVGAIHVRSKESKAKVQRRARGMIFNTLGTIGVSNIDTETFKAKVVNA